MLVYQYFYFVSQWRGIFYTPVFQRFLVRNGPRQDTLETQKHFPTFMDGLHDQKILAGLTFCMSGASRLSESPFFWASWFVSRLLAGFFLWYSTISPLWNFLLRGRTHCFSTSMLFMPSYLFYLLCVK